MQNSTDIINWPFNTEAAHTATVKEANATHPKTPYQPHHGYHKEYHDRRRLVTTLIALAFALFSDAASITLYVLIGLQEQSYAWLFRTWVVVSVGLTAMFVLLAVSFYRSYVKARRFADVEGGNETPLKAVGRREIHRESQSITRAPLVQKEIEERELTSPMTVLHRYETGHLDSPCAVSDTPHGQPGHCITAAHMLSPVSYSRPSYDSPTPAPRVPSPAKLREHTTYHQSGSDDPFYREKSSQRHGSPDSVATVQAREAQVTRSDSLKKLREATLRRKQAFETLK